MTHYDPRMSVRLTRIEIIPVPWWKRLSRASICFIAAMTLWGATIGYLIGGAL